MSRKQIVSDADLRDKALTEARGSFGFRRHRLADLISRAEAFEAWLKPFAQKADYQGWLWAQRGLKLAAEDSRFDRGQRNVRIYDTRTVLRRAEAYRAFLAVS